MLRWSPIIVAMGLIAIAVAKAETSTLGVAPALLPSPYAPITLSEEDYTRIMNYLGEIPAKYAIPMLNALTDMERMAVLKRGAPASEPNSSAKPPKK